MNRYSYGMANVKNFDIASNVLYRHEGLDSGIVGRFEGSSVVQANIFTLSLV